MGRKPVGKEPMTDAQRQRRRRARLRKEKRAANMAAKQEQNLQRHHGRLAHGEMGPRAWKAWPEPALPRGTREEEIASQVSDLVKLDPSLSLFARPA